MPPRKNPNQKQIDTPVTPNEPLTARQRLLRQAEFITSHDRNKNYGAAEDNFRHIANLWMDYLAVSGREIELKSGDVAVMNMLIKIARLGNNLFHTDSALDVAGYAACLAECQEADYHGIVAGVNLKGCLDTQSTR